MQATEDLRRARFVASIAATAIALACGSNYVYSAWGPQFAEKLKLSSTESNLIGLAGNLGMYLLGVPIGIFIDDRGPRPAILGGSILLGVGYFPLHQAYDAGSGSVPLMCFFSFLSGLGGCMAFSAAVKTSALNWPENRGTATAFPLAAFGLSAFFFSLVGGILFPGDTSAFLMTLSIGTCGITFVSFFFLKVYPTSTYQPLPGQNDGDNADDGSRLRRTPSKESRKSQNSGVEIGTSMNASSSTHVSTATVGVAAGSQTVDETTSLMSNCPGAQGSVPNSSVDLESLRRLDLRGLRLLASIEFWQLFLTMAILAGIGLMTINNIGNDVKALWERHDDSVSSEFLVSRQQMHVSILSICSFMGRLGSGVGSDFLVKNLGASRVWCLVLATTIFTLAQLCALNIENPHLLGFVSGFSGLGYGFLFGVFPSLTAECFGIRGMSQNWGYMTMAPIISSNIFNIFYGRTYDKHTTVRDNGERVCMDGIDCYKAAYWATLFACGLGFLVTGWAIRSQYVKRARDTSKGDEED